MGSRIGLKIKKGLIRALHFIRITDPHDGNISITNLMLIAVLVKILTSKSSSYADMGMLISAIGNYTAKKFANRGLSPVNPPLPPAAAMDGGGSVTPLHGLLGAL